jgi:hypothetical protein
MVMQAVLAVGCAFVQHIHVGFWGQQVAGSWLGDDR